VQGPLLVLVAGVVGLVVAAIVVGALPRWWAHRIGDQVDGDLTTGLVIGFMYGFLAMILPIALLALLLRFFRRSWLAWVVGLVSLVILASPNLLTLWIVLGAGDAAHAGDRTLDVEAPWFRGGMLFGVIAALAVAVYVSSTVRGQRRARAEADRLRRQQEAAPTAPEQGSSSSRPPTR